MSLRNLVAAFTFNHQPDIIQCKCTRKVSEADDGYRCLGVADALVRDLVRGELFVDREKDGLCASLDLRVVLWILDLRLWMQGQYSWN